MSNKCDLRERLNRTIQYARRLEHDLQRREALMAKATKTSASMQDVKVKASLANKHDILVAAIADLDTMIEAEREYLEYLKNWNRSFFEEAGLEADELDVMNRRYIDCLEWEEIAELLYYSKRHVQRIHGNALEKLVTRWHTLSRGFCDIV